MPENKDYVWYSNLSLNPNGYDTLNKRIENSESKQLRLGPALNPHTGEYEPGWQKNLIGEYLLNIPKGRIRSTIEGIDSITLADAIKAAEEFEHKSGLQEKNQARLF